MGDIIASATGQRLHLTTASNVKATNVNGGGPATAAATTTTTYLRLTNGNNNNHATSGNNGTTTIANIVHKNHNSSRVNLSGPATNVETIPAAAGAGAVGTALSNTATTVNVQHHLNLADVQLKHERTSTSAVASSTTGSVKAQGTGKF